jgi:hypothetical protein
MAMEVEPDSTDEKNDFLNRQDMAIGCILWFISPEILHQVYDDSQESTPNELWTRLEVLFGNKEDCEDFMQEVEQIEPEEKPSEDQASYYEESSTKVFAQICIPLIEDDVYSISDLFSEFHVEDIWHASQGSHADTFPCAMHASQETKREPRTSDSIMIFSKKNLQKKIGYLNSSRENIQFQKKNRPKRSPGSEVMIILKSTKFQRFSETVARFSKFHPNFIWIFFITRRESGYVWTSQWCIYFIRSVQTSTSSTKSSTSTNLHSCEVFLE